MGQQRQRQQQQQAAMPPKKKDEKGAAADAAPTDDPGTQEVMLVKELSSKRASVDHYRSECERLRKINHKLKQEMFERENANFEVIDHWRLEVDKKDSVIEKLKRVADDMFAQNEKEKNDADQLFEAKVNVLENELEHTETKAAIENQKLHDKVDELTQFAEHKEVLQKELEDLQREKKELEERQSETVIKMERKFIEEKARLQKDINRKLLAFKTASEEKVNENLDASTKRILMQNRQMADELRLHVQETNELLKTKSRLVAETKRLTRESELQKQEIAEFGQKCAAQKRMITQQQEKVKNLERSLSKVVHEFEGERVRWQGDSEKEQESAEASQETLALQLKAKERELKTLRRLAKDILRQRSDVEQFFLDSLEYVRERAVRDREERKRQFDREYLLQVKEATMNKGTAFPPIGKSPMMVRPSNLPASADEKVDLAQLTWEDKEQVLRMLFAKINHAQTGRASSAPGGAYTMGEEQMPMEDDGMRSMEAYMQGGQAAAARPAMA